MYVILEILKEKIKQILLKSEKNLFPQLRMGFKEWKTSEVYVQAFYCIMFQEYEHYNIPLFNIL